MQNLLAPLKALADENRLKIVELLLSHNFCVGALARQLGITEGAVSQQLQILRRSGLVKGEKRGYCTHYTVEREALQKLGYGLKALLQDREEVRYGCQREGLTTEQAKVLHLERRELKMCECGCGCQKPEKLRDEPGKCTPEQVNECHGDDGKHPCADEQK